MIAVLPGDGIGPEVIAEAVRVLDAVGITDLREAKFGGCAIDATGAPLPDQTLALCKEADAILLGAVGGPNWDKPPRPEAGLLTLRKELGVYANLRPVAAHRRLAHASTLRPEVVEGVDLIIVRELTGGIYFGNKASTADSAFDTCAYTEHEVARLVRIGAALAQRRRKRLCSVDKANVLETSRLWRRVAEKVVDEEFPDVLLTHQLVDSCAMQLIRDPRAFDVIVTENMFGDILSDEAAMIAGSIGMLPSASLGDGARGLYEPIHGSAPDIAGKGIANPLGTILSAAMMLRLSLRMHAEADAIEGAVSAAVERGVLTRDLGGTASCREVGDAVVGGL
ncbi:MAG: 3-isopropylmalate dehydrogenase [Myxococcales bacterium]|nr:3-isopropylmalate dehydrogenase [Myxococcales bacterium]